MIIFNKNRVATSKRDISLSLTKSVRRVRVAKNIKLTKENKQFLKYLGFKLQNVANHRSTTSR